MGKFSRCTLYIERSEVKFLTHSISACQYFQTIITDIHSSDLPFMLYKQQQQQQQQQQTMNPNGLQ